MQWVAGIERALRCGLTAGRLRFQTGGRSIVEKKKCCCPKRCHVAAGGNYGGGQLSLVSEVFVLTTWQVLSMQYSVTPSWKIVQRLKFHADWISWCPGRSQLIEKALEAQILGQLVERLVLWRELQ